MLKCYLPITCNVLVPGHILLIKKLEKLCEGEIVLGLLTSKALKGYKKERMKWEDRKFILEHITCGDIVPQDSLDPTENIKKYGCNALASGDGFEKVEEEAITKLALTKISLKSGHDLHSSDLR